jgi:hypothetical protein
MHNIADDGNDKLGIGGFLFVGFFNGLAGFTTVFLSSIIGQIIFSNEQVNLIPIVLAALGFVSGVIITFRKFPEYSAMYSTINRISLSVYLFVFLLSCISFSIGTGKF